MPYHLIIIPWLYNNILLTSVLQLLFSMYQEGTHSSGFSLPQETEDQQGDHEEELLSPGLSECESDEDTIPVGLFTFVIVRSR